MPFRPFRALPAPLSLSMLALLGLVTTSPFAATPAWADFRVCNGTQALVGVAIGYRADNGWTTEGWWRIPATTCKSIIEGTLSSRYYYLYAEDAEGQGRWAGNVDLCIDENEFKITDVKDCFARGYQKIGFREYDTGEQGSWMVQLTEAPRGGTGTP